jgi:hypothetical protein
MNSPAASFAVMAAATASPAPTVAGEQNRGADVQDRAVAALYFEREVNTVVARKVARARPSFRPASEANVDGRLTPRLLLDLALFDDATSAADSDPVIARPAADDDGHTEAVELLQCFAGDVLFGP